MVRNVTSFTGNGVADWLLQHISAVVLMLYTVFMVVYFLAASEWTYDAWVGLFSQGWMKIFTLLTMVAFVAHAWIGVWTATTDYLKNTSVRLLVQLAVAFTLFVYFVIVFAAVWGV